MAFEKYTPSPLERIGLKESTFKRVTKIHPLPWQANGSLIADAKGVKVLELYPWYIQGRTNKKLCLAIIETIVKAVNGLHV